MKRPYYETQDDLNNEKQIAKVIENVFKCELYKMPIKLSLDFMAMRNGKAVSFIEVRQRKNDMTRYGTYMISLYKLMMANNLTQATKLPCFLAVQFTDKFAITKFPPEDFYVNVEGSVKRGDPQDIEPMAHFNIENFKVLL